MKNEKNETLDSITSRILSAEIETFRRLPVEEITRRAKTGALMPHEKLALQTLASEPVKTKAALAKALDISRQHLNALWKCPDAPKTLDVGAWRQFIARRLQAQNEQSNADEESGDDEAMELLRLAANEAPALWFQIIGDTLPGLIAALAPALPPNVSKVLAQKFWCSFALSLRDYQTGKIFEKWLAEQLPDVAERLADCIDQTRPAEISIPAWVSGQKPPVAPGTGKAPPPVVIRRYAPCQPEQVQHARA